MKIKLTKGKYAIIDKEDFKRVSIRKWSYHHSGYVVGGKPQISLHRFIMNAVKGQIIDHVNHDKLDNRKNNLRFCTSRQNHYNSLSEDGVSWRPNRKAWIVRMLVNGKRIYVGYFKDIEKALKAREQASLKYHKEFSPYAKY